MKQKKQSSNWYIAATHYLTAGFAIPLIIGLIAAFTLFPLLEKTGSEILVILSNIVLLVLSIWFGVMYSARYLRSTYIIQNPKPIINISTIYMVVLVTIFLIIQILIKNTVGINILYDSVFFGVRVALFYIASSKYIGISETNSDTLSTQ